MVPRTASAAVARNGRQSIRGLLQFCECARAIGGGLAKLLGCLLHGGHSCDRLPRLLLHLGRLRHHHLVCHQLLRQVHHRGLLLDGVDDLRDRGEGVLWWADCAEGSCGKRGTTAASSWTALIVCSTYERRSLVSRSECTEKPARLMW